MSKDEKRRLEIEIEKVSGDCPIYEVGDKIIIDKFWISPNESDKICIHAFSAMATFLIPFSRGISAEKLGLGKQKKKPIFNVLIQDHLKPVEDQYSSN